MPLNDLAARAAYFCFRKKSSCFHCGSRNPTKERSGLGGAEVGKSVDFKERKISLDLLVLLGQAKSTGSIKTMIFNTSSPTFSLDPKNVENTPFLSQYALERAREHAVERSGLVGYSTCLKK